MVERQRLTVGRRARAARATSKSRVSPDAYASPYLAAARAIARELVETAVRGDEGLTWQGDDVLGTTVADLTVVRAPIRPALYSGTAGVGWFLGHLAAATGDRQLATTAIDTLHFALHGVRVERAPSLSLFSGLTGIAWAAVDVGARLGREDLQRAGLVLADDIVTVLETQRVVLGEPDLLAGGAGVVIGLLALHRFWPDERALNAAREAAGWLAAECRRDTFGVSWPDPASRAAPALCGLGHGVSGVTWALAEECWAAGETDLPSIVDEALRYERGWFSTERCAWADLREPPEGGASPDWPAWTAAWCHGAFGIGAVRWRLYEQTRDLTVLAEASSAIEAARASVAQASRDLRAGHLSDVTLCHGLGGAIELMLLAYEVTGERDHLMAARRAGDLCLAIREANQQRWTLGLRHAELVPGLFTGTAGIGVTMLRLHDVTAVASPMLPGRRRASLSTTAR